MNHPLIDGLGQRATLRRRVGCLLAQLAGLLVLVGCLFGAARTSRAEAAYSEYQVKALFLFNFAKYVDWPAETFATTNAPITIGVLGQDNFRDFLNHAVSDKNINGHP